MEGIDLCISICAIIWIVNGICVIQAIREHIASEIYMHIGLGIIFSLLALELTIGKHGAWTHFEIIWLEVIGWVLYIPSAILVFGSMIELKHKGKPKSADFTATTTFIDSGIYSFFRQPMTLGAAIGSVALVLDFQSILAVILGLVSLFCFWMSARKESEYDIRKFGDAYKEYMKKVPMWNILKGLRTRQCSCFILWTVTLLICSPESLPASQIDPSPPKEPVKLIFIHHSCGENWLGNGHGGLGRALAKNGYFVSDTNYGWGPDGIGDRTDITDWPEWFVGPRSRHYLRALFHESGQHSSYTRRKTDPGGENRIIMFKSCFPNSNLHGRPQDSPARGSGLTVANAKAIYQDLLRYFAKRPNKLFIAITAPPVQERTYGANARAFNNWLVHEWLADYKGSNVAVFDFYNVLTGSGNHHRLRNGRVEHVYTKGRNHLFYPTNGDDHPSPRGNRKATKEFMPLLNAYYHQWKTNAPAAVVTTPPEPAASTEVAEEAEEREERPAPTACAPSKPITPGGIIDDFEGDGPEWAAFVDESNDTRLSFVRDSSQSHKGEKSLRIDYNVAPEGWATCSLVLAAPADWRKARGLTVCVHASESGQPVTLTAYQGKSSDSLSHFELKTETTGDAVSGWQKISATWDQLKQPPWEGDGSTPFDPGSAMGIAFVFSGGEKGRLWVDDIRFIEGDGAGPR